jgi:glycosyltransferase involved in cell wall biosynthesis
VIVPGHTGYLIPADDEQMFASVVRMLLNDAMLRSRLGKTARKRAIEEFDLSHMTMELEKISASSSDSLSK